MKNINSNVVKCRSKNWFLKTCLLINLVPVTLQSKVRDPLAHQPGYSSQAAEAWAKAQKAAGRKLVEEALDREVTRLKILRLKERSELRDIQELLNDEEWLIATRIVMYL